MGICIAEIVNGIKVQIVCALYHIVENTALKVQGIVMLGLKVMAIYNSGQQY